MERRLITIIVGIGVFAAAALAGYWTVRGLAGDTATPAAQTTTSTSPPEQVAEKGIPVVVPAPYMGDVDDAIVALAEDTYASRVTAAGSEIPLDPAGKVLEAPGTADAGDGTASSGGDGSPSGDSTTAAPATAAPAGSTTVGTAATAPSTSGIGETPGGGSSPAEAGLPTPGGVPLPEERAVDTCTEGGTGCPEGVSGTILAIRTLPPLAGMAESDPPVPGSGEGLSLPECPAREAREGTAYFGVATNRPAIITVEYRTREWRPERGAVPWTTFTTTTSDAADARWARWFADDTASDRDPASWIDTCFVLEGLAPRDDYEARFTYAAKEDPTVTATNFRRLVPFTVPGSDGSAPGSRRRPTTVLPLGIGQLFVGTTRTAEQQLAVVARPGNDPASCEIAGAERSIPRGAGTVRAATVSERPIDPEVLDDPSYPYFPDYSISVVERLDLEEGTDYVVCIYWLDAGPAFDPTTVTEVETVAVSTPEAYRPTITVQRLTNLVGDADRVFLGFSACGGRSVVYDLTDPAGVARDRAGARQTLAPPKRVCTVDRRLNDIDRRGIRIDMTVQRSDGTTASGTVSIRTNLSCDATPCRLRLNELAMVALPEIAVGGDCRPGFGSGCLSGSVPAGDAVIELTYDPSAGSRAATWSVGSPSPFTDSPPPLPEDPRVAVTTDYRLVDGHPAGGARATLSFVADRPVTLQATIGAASPSDDVCSLGPVESYSSASLSTTHTVTFDPLCLGQGYRVTVTAADETGRIAEVVGEIPPTSDNTIVLFVPPALLTTEMSVSVSAPDSDHSHTVSVHPAVARAFDVTGPVSFDLGWTWPAEDRLAARDAGWQLFGLRGQANACGQPGARDLEVFARRTARGVPVRSSMYAAQDGAEISLVVDVFENRPIGGAVLRDCVPGDAEESIVLRSNVSIEDLFRGITLTSDSGLVRFTIRAVGFRASLIG